MAVDTTRSLLPAAQVWRARPVGVRARLGARGLDDRLAAGENPASDALLACRSAQLVSRRARCRIAEGLERLLSERAARAVYSAAIPFNGQAVKIGRPALQQLARALRAPESAEPQGVAIALLVLTEPSSALYRPAYPEQLYEIAREALIALTPQLSARGLNESAQELG